MVCRSATRACQLAKARLAITCRSCTTSLREINTAGACKGAKARHAFLVRFRTTSLREINRHARKARLAFAYAEPKHGSRSLCRSSTVLCVDESTIECRMRICLESHGLAGRLCRSSDDHGMWQLRWVRHQLGNMLARPFVFVFNRRSD
jgi:hypothetical protein